LQYRNARPDPRPCLTPARADPRPCVTPARVSAASAAQALLACDRAAAAQRAWRKLTSTRNGSDLVLQYRNARPDPRPGPTRRRPCVRTPRSR
jgi:hypothetical protein